MIVITGGGTGGHLRIAKIIKDELNKRGIKPIYIGSTGGQDKEWFENDIGFEKTLFLNTRGVVNKNIVGKVFHVFNIFKESLKLLLFFRRNKIKKVFSVGGYSAAPAVFAAIMAKKELYIHEQNAKVGMLNKISKPFCKFFFSSFDDKSVCKNYPVERSFFENRRVRKEVKIVLFMGGSLGAKAINKLAMESAEEILKKEIKIIHITGKKEYEEVKNYYNQRSLTVECMAFDKEIAKTLAKCDFAISRAGASSLFELYASAIPTLFIPYPYAALDHQYYNANSLVENDMAYCKRESEITREYLLEILEKNHSMMSKKLYDAFSNDGAKCIVKHLID
ncbi:MAG: UDP-N-acetylglucosamine--N-acetylmuramyl-(pentapeptide) pyrophosphoryl-undecaprenol [Campylobacterota bacterium]|nr:UDP-N-acetylglucosamine--N-acetylmuramyl-(pentapeptide) pyrophosphoryl-undecaprenol [Campylobacterota bacterium]